MKTTPHETLIRDTVAALISEYREKRPRCTVETYVTMGIKERIGALDEAEQGIVDAMIEESNKPRAWDGKAWRGNNAGTQP